MHIMVQRGYMASRWSFPVMLELCKDKSDSSCWFKEIWFGARLLWVRSTIGNINLYRQCPTNLQSQARRLFLHHHHKKRSHTALCCYPHVKWEIENLSQITTTAPHFLAIQLFQTEIFGDCLLRSELVSFNLFIAFGAEEHRTVKIDR